MGFCYVRHHLLLIMLHCVDFVLKNIELLGEIVDDCAYPRLLIFGTELGLDGTDVSF